LAPGTLLALISPNIEAAKHGGPCDAIINKVRTIYGAGQNIAVRRTAVIEWEALPLMRSQLVERRPYKANVGGADEQSSHQADIQFAAIARSREGDPNPQAFRRRILSPVFSQCPDHAMAEVWHALVTDAGEIASRPGVGPRSKNDTRCE
jgi:hypothetical protein